MIATRTVDEHGRTNIAAFLFKKRLSHVHKKGVTIYSRDLCTSFTGKLAIERIFHADKMLECLVVVSQSPSATIRPRSCRTAGLSVQKSQGIENRK